MVWNRDRTASATADFVVIEPAGERNLMRAALRGGAMLGLLLAFAYCAETAWEVLGDLGRVSVADVTQALRVVSVRDAILCMVGWRIGRELLVALVQRRRGV